MSNTKIFHLLSGDKDIASMQQLPESLQVPSEPKSLDSSLSPLLHQDSKSERKQNHQEQELEQEQDQAQEQEREQDQEKIHDESTRKRKWECEDEASRVETPRESYTRSYHPPRPPRKPKASPAMKRRAMWVKRSVVFLDVAREVESMFPPSLLQDFGNKIKKARS